MNEKELLKEFRQILNEELDSRFANFEELYSALPLLQCGYTEEDIADAKPEDMLAYYSSEQQKKFGVVGIEISLNVL